MSAVARTNVADPADIAGTLLPELTQGMSPAERSRVEHYTATQGQEFGRRFDTGSCEVASATARRVGLGAGVQRALREAVEWWNGDGPPRGLRGDEIALPARIARAAADAARFDDLGGSEAAVGALRRRSGGILDPSLVEAFAANADRLLEETRAGDPRERMLEAEPEPVVEIDVAELTAVAAAFGDLADMKMPWTHGHSAGVARLAEAPPRVCVSTRRPSSGSRCPRGFRISAGLRSRMRSGRSLAAHAGRMGAGPDAPLPLGAHPRHIERAGADGPQSPACITSDSTVRVTTAVAARASSPHAARIVAASDAYQAMTEERPHRTALSAEQAGEELQRDVRAGRLDGDAVSAVLEAAGGRRGRRRDNLRPGGLSEREIEVLRLVAAGCSNPEIATRLVISRRTAEHHVQHIYAKVGVSSRAGLALFAHEHGLTSEAANA